MLYDNSDSLIKRQFLARAQAYADAGELVEMTRKRIDTAAPRPEDDEKKRSLKQNNLFHLWISVMADYMGEPSLESAKTDIKRALLGQWQHYNKLTRKVEYRDYETHIMSSSEMGFLLDKMQAWAWNDFNVVLPSWEEEGYEEMVRKYSNGRHT